MRRQERPNGASETSHKKGLYRRLTLRRSDGRVYLNRWGIGDDRIGGVLLHRMDAPDPGTNLHDPPVVFRLGHSVADQGPGPMRIRARGPGRIRARGPGRIRARGPGRIRARGPGRIRARGPRRIRARGDAGLWSRTPQGLGLSQSIGGS